MCCIVATDLPTVMITKKDFASHKVYGLKWKFVLDVVLQNNWKVFLGEFV